jgi:hypothetical protein
MHRHLVFFGHQKVNGFAGVRKRAGLARQKVSELITAANPGLARRGAVSDKIRREQLINAPPVPLVDGFDVGSYESLVLFRDHRVRA